MFAAPHRWLEPIPYRRAAKLFWLLILLAGCGAAEPGLEPEPGQTTAVTDRVQVADSRFDGDFLVTSVTSQGAPVELISFPVVTIETVFGGLTVRPGCNTFFGSFTLDEDGTASFTIAGGSGDDCDELGRQETEVVRVLGTVTSWANTDDGFAFEGPNGDRLVLSR